MGHVLINGNNWSDDLIFVIAYYRNNLFVGKKFLFGKKTFKFS